MPPNARNEQDLGLADLLDRALHKGVVVWGEATISLAGVDLIYVGLKVLVASVDAAQRMKEATDPARIPTGLSGQR